MDKFLAIYQRETVFVHSYDNQYISDSHTTDGSSIFEPLVKAR